MDTERSNSRATDSIELEAQTRADTARPVSGDQSLATARDEDLDETNAEDVILARPEWGSVAMLAAAASFGAAVPGAVAAANRQTFMSVERYGEFSISNGGGPIGQLTKEEIAAKKQEEADDGWTDWAQDMAEAYERQEREREEWSRTAHSFAGVEMTGQEWGELSQAVGKGGALHETLVERLMQKGKSRKDAEAKANEIAEIYKLMSKPKSELTPQEQTKIDAADRDPEFQDATRYLDEQKAKGITVTNKLEQVSTAAGQTKSVSVGADAFDAVVGNKVEPVKSAVTATMKAKSPSDFPSAPDLQTHHQAALAATEPLDAPKRLPQLAAITSTPAPGGGFDV